ncbi:MAG: DNA repair protein RecN [Actinomycetota bacterium]|nr:DNA repair protein RecN [Actinomycetota bacterium]
MLSELRVSQLGVIDDVTVLLGPGMTAVTGETGAGKTLLVEAVELLLGARADPTLVRPGAAEAGIEGRFIDSRSVDSRPGGDAEGDERVLRRAVPAQGRSRCYIDGQMVASSVLGDAAGLLVDLHGQNAHQSLLSAPVQRAALDAAGGIDDTPVRTGRAVLREIDAELEGLGGDARSRARELDLLAFQLGELDDAGLDEPDEDDVLHDEEVRLGDATAQRHGAEAAVAALTGEDGVLDRLALVVAAVAGRPSLVGVHDRLRALDAELADTASDLRAEAETLVDDPERLQEVSARRHLLGELRRKYGDTLAAVIEYREQTRARHAELDGYEARATALESRRGRAVADLAAAEQAVGDARRRAAPGFADAVTIQLHTLAMARARFDVEVGDDPAGKAVTWLLGANPGEPALPLAKVASGGELARTMLAVRLVLSGALSADPGAGPAAGTATGPARTLIFDEVDAGIGGEAAVAVGRALAALAGDHQVLVVTHLPQVAAFATDHLRVRKTTARGRTAAEVSKVEGGERVVELSRMLSGQPGSDTARRHAEELLAMAGRSRPAR